MKINKLYKKLAFFLMLIFVISISTTNAQTLSDRLSGKILLEVEKNGEAWYVYPQNQQRYYLGRPHDAFAIMRELGLGINERDYNTIVNNDYYAKSGLKGKIILRVEANGEAYYVNPEDSKIYYLGRPRDAFNVMRNLGLGIQTSDLEKITASANTSSPTLTPTPNPEPQPQPQPITQCERWEVYNENTKQCEEDLSCNQTDFKMVFVLVETEEHPATQKMIDDLSLVKDAFPAVFSKATRELARMDTSYQVKVVRMPELALEPNDKYDEYHTPERIMQEFYKQTGRDVFDFSTIYLTYDNEKYSSMGHTGVMTIIDGISESGFQDYSDRFGSKSVLKGVNSLTRDGIDRIYGNMGDVDIETQTGGILHETGHYWCCYVGDPFDHDKENRKLEITRLVGHWYPGLESEDEYSQCIMGTSNWKSNGDGTFSTNYENVEDKFHPFVLYFMGLLPRDEYYDKYKVYDIGGGLERDETGRPIKDIEPDWKNSTRELYKEVSVNDIITAEGPRRCVNR